MHPRCGWHEGMDGCVHSEVSKASTTLVYASFGALSPDGSRRSQLH